MPISSGAVRSPRNIVAGLSVAALMMPEAVAYAGIAGLPPARALVAAIFGSAAYLLVGRSRVAIVSPTSSSATILAAALAAMGATVGDREALATVLIAIVGLIFLAAGALRLGALSSFVSRPVLRGFALGLAITIIVRQLPTLLGITDDGRSIGSTALTLAAGLGRVNPISTVTGVGALISLLQLRRWRMVPAALVVLTLGIVASITLDLSAHGVAVVGPIVVTFTVPRFPTMSVEAMLRLAQLAAPLTLIIFAESWGTIRTLALRHDDKVDPGRELVGLGVANLVSAFAQGMPVGAGFSAGSANEGAGGSSKLAALTASLALAVLVALAMPLIAQLPKPVLAAVVIAALTHALDPAWLVQLWRLKRDALIALAATAGVLLLGVVNGMLLAILLSVVAFKDDPYRSLAGAVLREGGYAKSQAPFAEFLWADFLKHRIDAKLLSHDFDRAARKALELARSKRADHLPGWAGPST